MEAEKRQTMNQAMIGSLALRLSLSIWPARQTLAAIDSGHQSPLGAKLQITDEQAPLRLAKHQDDDVNLEQENEDQHQRKHGKHHADVAAGLLALPLPGAQYRVPADRTAAARQQTVSL